MRAPGRAGLLEIVTTQLYEHLCNGVFVKFIEGDAELMQRIRSFAGNVSCDTDTLTFDLPSLFEFVCQDHERECGAPCDASRSTYLRFRKRLYEEPTNARLREYGGEVTLEQAHARHDRRLYKLSRKRLHET